MFKKLKSWYLSKFWYEKLFIIIILLRPISEPLFFLKSASPLLSPLYWLGILTFLVSVVGIFSNYKYPSKFDLNFGLWTFFVVFNVICFYFTVSLMDFLFFSLKLLNPVLIFYFLRGFIKSKKDLDYVLMTILISCFVAFIWYIYDVLKFGMNLREGTSFADIVNYGFYTNIALIVTFYYFFQKISKTNKLFTINNYLIITVVLFNLLILFSIKHLSSISVSFIVIALYVYFTAKKKVGVFFLSIGIILSVTFLFGDKFYQEVINERIEKEVEVVEGNRAKTQAFHGRGSRWDMLFKEFFESSSISQFVGFPVEMKYSLHMIGITPHNDFFRILFFTGYLGVFFYVRFIFLNGGEIFNLKYDEKFLATASLITFFLYSVSTVPTFYPGFNNFIFIIFAFIALPKNKRNVQTK